MPIIINYYAVFAIAVESYGIRCSKITFWLRVRTCLLLFPIWLQFVKSTHTVTPSPLSLFFSLSLSTSSPLLFSSLFFSPSLLSFLLSLFSSFSSLLSCSPLLSPSPSSFSGYMISSTLHLISLHLWSTSTLRGVHYGCHPLACTSVWLSNSVIHCHLFFIPFSHHTLYFPSPFFLPFILLTTTKTLPLICLKWLDLTYSSCIFSLYMVTKLLQLRKSYFYYAEFLFFVTVLFVTSWVPITLRFLGSKDQATLLYCSALKRWKNCAGNDITAENHGISWIMVVR